MTNDDLRQRATVDKGELIEELRIHKGGVKVFLLLPLHVAQRSPL
jgi:hypothetical protein